MQQAIERPLGIVPGTGVLKGAMAAIGYRACTGGNARTFGIYRQGLFADLETNYQRTIPELVAWAKSQPRRIVALGHSQGALHVARFALEYPELVEEVILLCGPLDGTALLNLVPRQLRPVLDSTVPALGDMAWHSSYTSELRDRLAAEWPESVQVSLIAVGGDLLVRPRRSATELVFPANAVARRYYLGTWRPPSLPEAIRYSWAPGIGHISVVVHPTALAVIHRARNRPAASSQVAA